MLLLPKVAKLATIFKNRAFPKGKMPWQAIEKSFSVRNIQTYSLSVLIS
jgi:hypothetical protein